MPRRDPPRPSAAGRPNPRFMLSNFVGNAAETTIAAAHLVFGGVLQRHPDLRICLVHGGGYLPYQAARLDHGYEQEPRLVDRRIDRPPSHYLRRMYYDTVTHSPEVIRFLVDFAGHDRVVLGTDYPFEMGERDPLGLLQRAGSHDRAGRHRGTTCPPGGEVRHPERSPDRRGRVAPHRSRNAADIAVDILARLQNTAVDFSGKSTETRRQP